MIPGWVKYLARNEDGELRGFLHKPFKTEVGYWLWKEISMTDYGTIIRETDDGFEDVRWSDNKAIKVKQKNTAPVSPGEGASDPIEPLHYRANGMEAIDVIEAFNLNFHLGNVIKYTLRAGKKGSRLEDLNKVLWYIEREIANEANHQDS